MGIRGLVCSAGMLVATSAFAQIGTIATVAGGGATQGPATTAGRMAVDSTGALLVPDTDRVIRVTPAGQTSFLPVPGLETAGTPNVGCLVVDASDRIHVCLAGEVKRIESNGTMTTVATGMGALNAGAYDIDGTLLVASNASRYVYRISGSTVTIVAGNGQNNSAQVGVPATTTSIQTGAIAPDGVGGFYASGFGPIDHVNAAGTLDRSIGKSGLPGMNTVLPNEGVVANDASIIAISLALDMPTKELYFGCVSTCQQVFRIDAGGILHRVAGNGGFPGPSGDGQPATGVSISAAYGIARDAAGNTYIAEPSFTRMRRVNAAGIISTLPLGSASGNGDGRPATQARLTAPQALAVTPDGAFDIGDTAGLRHVDAAGVISSIAGLATGYPIGLARDGAGNLYASDTNSAVRKRAPDGTITTLTSTTSGFSGDGGPSTAAKVSLPRGLAVDAAGNLYIADLGNNRIRRIAADGTITTVATNLTPWALALDAAGRLFITDTASHRVLVLEAGALRVFAGIGAQGFGGDGGLATAAILNAPKGVAVDDSGNVYIGDTDNHRVRKVSPSGVITTIAGTGANLSNGDGGPATAAAVSSPAGLAWDPAGALLIAESNASRVRRILVGDSTPNAFTLAATTGVATGSVQTSSTVTPTGYIDPAAVTVSGGEYSIGCTGTFTAAAGTMSPGDSVCVRHTASAANNASTETTLTVGGVAARFRSTTVVGSGSITLSAASLDFGGQSMFTTSPAMTITLTNAGTAPVTVNAISADGGFTPSSTCTTIAAGATCNVTVTFTPRAQGAVTGTLRLQNSPGTQSVSLAGVGEKSLVTHYYRSVLGRAPDAQGTSFWNGEAARLAAAGVNVNETWFAMSQAFFFSAEYIAKNRDDAGFLGDLYRTFFNRAPDPSGNSFWLDQLQKGMPREVVLVSFQLSSEFVGFAQAIFGNTAARAEVDVVMDFYRGLLARLPDETGLQTWVGRLQAAQCGPPGTAAGAVTTALDDISTQFLGAEYVARNRSNGQFVGDLYNAFMRRGGDPVGVKAFISALDSGALTREQVRKRFRDSYEFAGRGGAIIAQGCLP